MSLDTKAPEAFEVLEGSAGRIWVRPEVRSWAEGALARSESLHERAARSPDARRMSGRGVVFALPAPEGDAEGWVVRHYERGGSVARFLGDRYVRGGEPRPFREARVSERVRELGIPTPRVLAAAVYRGAVAYRGDLVTGLIPEALELAEVLFDPERTGVAGSADRKEALREAGNLIRKMAAAGIRHADLNARNILLRWYAAPDGFVLDLDRCRLGSGPDPRGARAMAQRLLRSIRKLERKTGLRVPGNEREILWEALG